MAFFSDKDLSEIRALANVQEKIEYLKDAAKGQTCYILACGPSIKEYSPETLARLLDGKLVLSLKQAFYYAPSVTDILILNSWNFQKYDFEAHAPLVVREEGPNDPPVFHEGDIELQISNPGDMSQQLAQTNDFEPHTFDKTLVRPWGPGVLYEVGFYLAEYLGVNEIVTLGWDVGAKDSSVMPHFYETSDPSRTRLLAQARKIRDIGEQNKFLHDHGILYNKPRIIPNEVDACAQVSGPWRDWLNTKGIALKVVSNQSLAEPTIERVRLEDVV